MRDVFYPRWLRKACAILVATTFYQLSQWIARRANVARVLFPDLSNHYLWIRHYEHHLWQMVFALLCIAVLSRGKFSQWGFNLRNRDVSWRLLWRFCLVSTIVVLALVVIPTAMTHDAGPGLIKPTTTGNTIGWLMFEWIFFGISEEVLFRGLIQTFLEQSFPGAWRVWSIQVPHAGLLTTVLFCLTHVPDWRHPQVAIDQQVIVFCLSLYASSAYYRTRSLAAPIMAHNFNDGLFVTAQTLCYRLLL